MNDTKTEERVKLLIDADMADTVARLNNLRSVLDLVKGSMGLAADLGVTPGARIEDAAKGE